MVYNIAIVEDQEADFETLQNHFAAFHAKYKTEFKLSRFIDGKSFLNEYRPVYDVIFMDIGLPEINGMKIAQQLREKDQLVALVFVTNMAQFAVKGYEVNAFDFVVKPVGYPNFAIKLKRVLSNLATRKEKEIILTLVDRVIRLSSSQIRYVESSSHNLIYHTGLESIRVYGKMKDAEAALGNSFARCNNCYLVNLNYVRGIRGYTDLVEDDELQISRPRRKEFIQALNTFLGGGLQ